MMEEEITEWKSEMESTQRSPNERSPRRQRQERNPCCRDMAKFCLLGVVVVMSVACSDIVFLEWNLKRNPSDASSAQEASGASATSSSPAPILTILPEQEQIGDKSELLLPGTMTTNDDDDQDMLGSAEFEPEEANDKILDMNGASSAVTTTTVDNRPWFVIHVGPPKTGTTTLQTELTSFTEYLALDRYAYKGREYHPSTGRSDNLVMNPFLPDFVYHLRSACSDVHSTLREKQEALQLVKQELSEYLAKNMSVITSDEVYGKVLTSSPECFRSIHETLGADWNIVVVVNYRRLFEWVPSSKFQQERGKMDWPGDEKYGGKRIGPLFPGVLQEDHFYRGYQYTDFCIDQVKKSGADLSVRVLNLHEIGNSDDLLSYFLCNVLENATHSCRASRERLTQLQQQQAQENNFNVRAPDQGNVLYYDALACAAYDRGWITDPTKWHRWTVKDMVQDYYTNHDCPVAPDTTTSNIINNNCTNTAFDFPQICPSLEELKEFLMISLQLEEAVLGSSDSATTVSRRKQEHKAAFWNLNRTTAFCWVDINTTLSDPSWREYFVNQFT